MAIIGYPPQLTPEQVVEQVESNYDNSLAF
jgi:hypothetical protein